MIICSRSGRDLFTCRCKGCLTALHTVQFRLESPERPDSGKDGIPCFFFGIHLVRHLPDARHQDFLFRVIQGIPVHRADIPEAGFLHILPGDIIFRSDGNKPPAGIHCLFPGGFHLFRIAKRLRNRLNKRYAFMQNRTDSILQPGNGCRYFLRRHSFKDTAQQIMARIEPERPQMGIMLQCGSDRRQKIRQQPGGKQKK